MSGSDWVKAVKGLTRPELMAAVLEGVSAGKHVTWPMAEVRAGPVTFRAAKDYFAMGTPQDFVRVPLDGATAQAVADLLGATLPTSRMVDAIWHAAHTKLPPSPWGPPYDASMMSIARFVAHHAHIEDQIAHLSDPPGCLLAGHKKDVVLTNKLVGRPDRLAIYGWHRSNGSPIQGPVPSLAHELTYYDYSHGIRLVDLECQVGGVVMPIREALQDANLAKLLSAEGVMRILRYPGPHEEDVPTEPSNDPPPDTDPRPGATTMPTIRRGSAEKDAIKTWQSIAGVKVDGDFGPKTEAATKLYQREHGLTPDGVVGPKTWAVALAGGKSPAHADTDRPPPVIGDAIPFKQARNYTKANRGPGDVDWVVIHTMEAAEHPGTAENVASWFAGSQAPRASAHYNVDGDSIVQSVHEKDVAWHAPGANGRGIGIEHAGYARQTAEDWQDAYSQAMLGLSAKLVAGICQRWNIPVEFVDAAGLKAGKRGLTYHREVSKAWKKSDHWDPGGNFPIDQYLDLVRSHLP